MNNKIMTVGMLLFTAILVSAIWAGAIGKQNDAGRDNTIIRLKAELATLKAAPSHHDKTIASLKKEMARVRRDVDVCHKRVDDVFWSLQVVARVPGARVHAPTTPTRPRPK